MVQPVRPFQGPRPSDEDGAPPAPASRALALSPDPPEPPLLPYADSALYTRAIRAMSTPREAQEAGLEVTLDPERHRDALVQQRLDIFRALATTRFRAEGADALVTAPFQMGGFTAGPGNAAIVRAVAQSIGLSEDEATRALFGRATPGQVHRLAQGLIDAGRLPAPNGTETLAARIRRMMYDHGVGFDCAGYVAQAFLASRAMGRAQSPLRSVPAVTDDLSRLEGRGFVRVPITSARPGDIVALAAPAHEAVGHRVIVYAARVATNDDRIFVFNRAAEALSRAMNRGRSNEISVAQRDLRSVETFLRQPGLRALVVDSSWGASQVSDFGGVERRIWLQDERTGQWAWTDAVTAAHVSDKPYDHPVQGVYRPAREL